MLFIRHNFFEKSGNVLICPSKYFYKTINHTSIYGCLSLSKQRQITFLRIKFYYWLFQCFSRKYNVLPVTHKKLENQPTDWL